MVFLRHFPDDTVHLHDMSDQKQIRKAAFGLLSGGALLPVQITQYRLARLSQPAYPRLLRYGFGSVGFSAHRIPELLIALEKLEDSFYNTDSFMLCTVTVYRVAQPAADQR